MPKARRTGLTASGPPLLMTPVSCRTDTHTRLDLIWGWICLAAETRKLMTERCCEGKHSTPFSNRTNQVFRARLSQALVTGFSLNFQFCAVCLQRLKRWISCHFRPHCSFSRLHYDAQFSSYCLMSILQHSLRIEIKHPCNKRRFIHTVYSLHTTGNLKEMTRNNTLSPKHLIYRYLGKKKKGWKQRAVFCI